MENLENNLNELVSELLTNYKKFVDKKNNSAGTRARKNAQDLKKLLQTLRKDVLRVQKERKAEKAVSAGASELIESVTESVTETEVSPPVVQAKSGKKTKAKKTKAKKTKAKKTKKAKTKSA